MQCTLVLLPFVLSLVVVATHQINITKDYELEEFLCSGTQLLNDTTVKLSTNISHVIRNASFCVINTTYSLSIISNSSQQAVIQCNDSIIQPTSGFAFINVQKMTLLRLVFKRCGGYLKELEFKKSTMFPFNLTQYHSAVTLFLHIKVLVIKEVSITHYYGFAMFAINPMNAFIDHCEVSLSYGGNPLKHKKSYGSGIFLLFANDTVLPSSTFNVSIHQNTFHYNVEYNHETENICRTGCNPMVNAAGLTILYIHNSFAIKVNVMQSIFKHNLAHTAAGILIIHCNSALQSQTRIINSLFRKNFNIKKHKEKCPGSDLLLLFLHNDNIQYSSDTTHPLVVSKTSFSGHNSLNKHDQGIIYINISNPSTLINVIITFNEVHFESINAQRRGSCLYAVSDVSPHNVQIIMKDITAVKNSQISAHSFAYVANQQSIFAIENFDILYLSGKSSYSNNYGSVISIINTKVILSGQLLFENNTGIMGAAFSLIGSSKFILQDGLVAVFNRNAAFNSGGALYAYNDITHECMFTPNGSNISMLFRHNTATYSGNSIFSNNLYNCSMLPGNLTVPQAITLYHNISNGTLNKGLSTTVDKLCVCHRNSSTCTVLKDAINVYPGMTLYFSIAAFDAFNQITYTEISLNLLNESLIAKHFPSLNWYIDSNGRSLSQGKCTLVNIPLFKRHDIVDNSYLALIIIASINPQDDRHFYIHLLPSGCPVGFEFYQSTHRCECSHVFNKLGYQSDCKITSDGYNSHITIELTVRSLSSWIGVINSTNEFIFGVSNACYHYCNYNIHYDTFIIHENMVMLANSDDDYSKKVNLCAHNREGPLCSQCAPGYSSVFGSVYHCKQCNNWWLFTLLVYGIAGPFLVFILYTFNLTLTSGEINAIIFYAQILNTHVPVPFEKDRLTLKTIYLTVNGLLFLINLNIAFDLPLCLYDGMTELWKSGIGLMFPVYLLTIVIGLIIISRYSVRLSNRIADSSVQVLVTVVHLSVATLLSSILDVFTPAYVYTNTSDVPLKVWQNDGTVEYGKGGHLILIIVTGVVVSSILITYLSVLLAGRPLMKINKVREYLRPIYEAIHAPYKHKKEFFFSSSIIFVVFLYLLSATMINNNPNLGSMIGRSVTCIYFIVVGFSQPFKDTRLNILNVFIFSIIALTGSAWSFIDSPASNVFFIIVVMLCHITVIITVLSIFMSRFTFVKKFVGKVKMACISKISHHSAVYQKDMMHHDSFYQSCSEREPLILVDK